MKILHVLASNRFAGAERVAINVIKNMPEDDCTYVSPPGPIADQLRTLGIAYHPVNRLTPWDMQKVINYYQPDIIHAHDYRASVMSAYTKKRSKLVSHLHCNYPWANRINPRTCLYSCTIPEYERIITVSEAIRDDFVWPDRIKSRVKVLHNVIDLQQILSAACEQTIASSDLLFMGRLTEQKDPLAFIALVAEIKKVNPNINARMLGEGELKASCQSEIERLQVGDNIEFLGFKSNPFPYVTATKLVVMPSKWEGFALVAMEALSLGKPVVANNVGGFQEVVKNTETGYLCNSFAEMVNKVNLLLGNDELLQEMSRQATEWAAQNNRMEDYIAVIKDIYAGVNKLDRK